MRCLAVIPLSLVLISCGAPEPKTVVRTLKVEAPRKIEYLPCPEDIAPWRLHCAAISTPKACDAEQRCQWVNREKAPHCRRIYCKPHGLPWPR